MADELMAGAKKREEEAKSNPSKARSDENTQYKEENNLDGQEDWLTESETTKTVLHPLTDQEYLSEPLSKPQKEKNDEPPRNFHSKQKPSVRKKIQQMKQERARTVQNHPAVLPQKPISKER